MFEKIKTWVLANQKTAMYLAIPVAIGLYFGYKYVLKIARAKRLMGRR